MGTAGAATGEGVGMMMAGGGACWDCGDTAGRGGTCKDCVAGWIMRLVRSSSSMLTGEGGGGQREGWAGVGLTQLVCVCFVLCVYALHAARA